MYVFKFSVEKVNAIDMIFIVFPLVGAAFLLPSYLGLQSSTVTWFFAGGALTLGSGLIWARQKLLPMRTPAPAKRGGRQDWITLLVILGLGLFGFLAIQLIGC